MYMHGVVTDVKNVLVDIGTGYFAEKSIPAALTFFESKMTMVSGNIETVDTAIVGKRNDLSKVRAALQQRIAIMQQQQQQQ
jgi:prefoldin alpha subunit